MAEAFAPLQVLKRVARAVGDGLSAGLSAYAVGAPPAPSTTTAEQEYLAGRLMALTYGVNLTNTPRRGERVSFVDLRKFADNVDLVRLVLESRKDEVCGLSWQIVPAGWRKGQGDPKALNAPEVVRWNAFFSAPSPGLPWGTWLRPLLDDLFVIDAATLYLRKTVGGDLLSLDVMDGATVKRVVDQTGRTPAAPDPAYQQSLNGVITANYTVDELIYKPRNPRSYKLYGMSPVEQILTTVQVAQKRQQGALDYYTVGNVPDSTLAAPQDKSSAQALGDLQKLYDELLGGSQQLRRRIRVIPYGSKLEPIKQAPLKDEFDEWLARVVCYAFSVSPTPFVAQVNRSVAETTQEVAISQGLAAIKAWVKELIDDVLRRFAPGLAFTWTDLPAVNPKDQAAINVAYVGAKILTADEVRADIGRAPLTEAQKAELAPAPVVMPPVVPSPGDKNAVKGVLLPALAKAGDPPDPKS